jgi:hypothetical protein
MAKITAPVKGYAGIRAGVQFTDGTAETDDEGALAYFRRAGYDVDGSDDTGLEDQEGSAAAAPAVLGNIVTNPPGPLDAADPENDLVPVGGVKSAAAPAAPDARPAGRGKRKAATSDQPADTTPQAPVAANGGVQSANSATTATTPSAAPVGDTTAADATTVTPAPDPTKPAVSSPDTTPADTTLTDGTAGTEAAKATANPATTPDATVTDSTPDAKASDTTKGA